MAEPTLQEVLHEIELLETAEAFGEQLQQFTDWMSNLSGGEITNWMSDDPTVRYELGQLKDAAFEFSESLNEWTEFAQPLGTAAETAGNINTVVQAVLSFSTAVAKADESTGADKARQMADVISGVTDLAKLMTGLSVNPVIGVFIGLYATALQSAAVGLERMEEYAQRRNAIINSRGGEIDVAAELAAQEEAAAQADEAQRALNRRLSDLYTRRGELIAELQAGQYAAALDFCASRNRDGLRALIELASTQGGIVSNATPNGESLEQIENMVGGMAGAAFDLMTQAQTLPEGSDARAEAVRRAEQILDTKRELIEGLGPFRDCVRDALDRYGYSTADAGAATGGGLFGGRRLVIAGGGIFAAAMVGLVIVIGGGNGTDEDGTPTPTGGGGAVAATSVSTSTPAPTTTAAPATEATATPTPDQGPPEGYTTCQIHPDEDALHCRPYYAPATSRSTLRPVLRSFDRTVTFRAPIPTQPELPLEYRLLITGAAGPRIEQILSGGPGEPLTCVQTVDGVEAGGAGDVCIQITAPDTLFMQVDLSAYGEGPLQIEWFATELEADGVLRGDYSNVQPDASLPGP